MKKLNSFYLLYLGVCIVLLLVAGQTGMAQKIRIIATDNVGRDTVVLGLRADATNDIDAALGEEELPPYSPSFDFRSTTNNRTPGKDTCVHGSGPGGLRINYHRLVTVTQGDSWKLRFQSDDANGTAVTFTWEILEAGAGGWEMEDGEVPANMTGNIDMSAQSSFTYPVKSSDGQIVYINYFDGLKLRTGTSHELANAPDAKGLPKGALIKLKADKYLACFTFPFPAPHTSLHVVFGSVVVTFPSLGGMTSAVNADLKGKDWTFTGAPNGPVIICAWVKGGKLPKVVYGYDGGKASLKDAVLKPGGQALNPMPNWWNVVNELLLQGAITGDLHNGKQGGLIIGEISPDGKTGHAVYHPKFGDVYKTLNKKGVYQDGLTRTGCLDGFDADPVKKPILKPQKSLPPDKFNHKPLGDAVAFRVNYALYNGAGKVPNAAGVFATLKYKHAGSPYDGMTMAQINGEIDAIMACDPLATHTPTELDAALDEINAAFSGAFDTSAWAGKLILKGVKAIGKSGVLYRNSLEAAPVMALPPFQQETKPAAFKLQQNYPNPFNPTTTIDFTLPAEGFVTLKVYNLLGQEVATLLNHEEMTDGDQTVDFDASVFSSGVYYYRLTLNDGEFTAVKKMMLLK